MDKIASTLHPPPSLAGRPFAPTRTMSAVVGELPAVCPVAVVAVSVAPGCIASLRPFLLSLGRSRTAGGLPVAPGSLAVLVLAAEPGEALPVVEALAPDYPFPLRVEAAASGTLTAVRRATDWATVLAAPDSPVLLADARTLAAPRWVYENLVALRDGADLVSRRKGALARLFFGLGEPIALSGRARRAMEKWALEGPVQPDAPWAGKTSPWRRPARSGLLAVSY